MSSKKGVKRHLNGEKLLQRQAIPEWIIGVPARTTTRWSRKRKKLFVTMWNEKIPAHEIAETFGITTNKVYHYAQYLREHAHEVLERKKIALLILLQKYSLENVCTKDME